MTTDFYEITSYKGNKRIGKGFATGGAVRDALYKFGAISLRHYGNKTRYRIGTYNSRVEVVAYPIDFQPSEFAEDITALFK